MIDPSEKLVYIGKDGKPWWRNGAPMPADSPRDLRWYLSVNDGRSSLVLTFDLRTLKLYARFAVLHPDDEARMI